MDVPTQAPLLALLHSLPLSSPSLPRSLSPLSPLRTRPLNAARSLGARCKLPIGVRGNQFWCILALNSDICWHQFYLLY